VEAAQCGGYVVIEEYPIALIDGKGVAWTNDEYTAGSARGE
jgi:hypothetical protein